MLTCQVDLYSIPVCSIMPSLDLVWSSECLPLSALLYLWLHVSRCGTVSSRVNGVTQAACVKQCDWCSDWQWWTTILRFKKKKKRTKKAETSFVWVDLSQASMTFNQIMSLRALWKCFLGVGRGILVQVHGVCQSPVLFVAMAQEEHLIFSFTSISLFFNCLSYFLTVCHV